MTHSSRVDWCVLSAIAVTIAALLFGASYWLEGPVLLVLMLWAYPQSYETADDGLLVREAVVRRMVPYHAIRRVSPCAAGLLRRGRLRIAYGPVSELIVAPANAAAFLKDLEHRCPHLISRAGELGPRDGHVEYRFAARRGVFEVR
jgi:hypothetical protein